jgi:hypothetical protein
MMVTYPASVLRDDASLRAKLYAKSPEEPLIAEELGLIHGK